MILISGEDAINYPILSNGAKGISVTSMKLPDMISKLTHLAFLEENYKEAKKINDELYNINKILFCESNPIPIKTAMYSRTY